MKKVLLCLVLLMSVKNVVAAVGFENEHQLMQRLVVFPLSVDKEYEELADSIWWDIRSELSNSKRFLIASKNFMQSKDIFQPRSVLKPADAILLGRLLDAHALITLSLNKYDLTLRAYDGTNGILLSQQSVELHPSVPASQQLAEVSKRLITDFVANIPYQAYVVTDSLIGQPAFKEVGVLSAYIYLGENHQVRVGDPVQIIRLQSKNLDPLFNDGGLVTVIAEAKVKSVTGDKALIELIRIPDPSLIIEGSLVRLPKEDQRLRETFKIVKKIGPTLELDALGQSHRMTDNEREKKPLVTALSFIANFVIMFLAVL